MKNWKRTLAALLAAIMLVMPFTASAELALEPDALPEVDGGMELEIAPESIGDAPDMELELPDAPELDGLGIDGIDLDAVTIENVVLDGAEAEAANPVLSNDDDSDFDIDDDGVLVEYKGGGGDVVIPDGVTSIGDSAFYECDSLTGVTIPSSVTSIGDHAFAYCENLASVTIPGSVTTIGDFAFWSCDSLTGVTIPASVTSIGDNAFAYCENLASVTIPGSVTSIGDSAFYECDSLTSVTIPASVTSIGEDAFGACDSLKAINVSGNNPSFTSRNGVLYTHDMKTLIQGPGAITTVIIPYGVTTIGEDAFAYCENLASVTIPGSVTTIGDFAFYECDSLTGVTIPASVTSIGYNAFGDCDSLNSVTILARSIDIDEDAFEDSDAAFHIVEGSDAIGWARSHGYYYDTFTEGLSQKSLTLEIGQTHRLTVRVQGKLTTDVAWSSSNKKVATVKNGTVTAIKAGKCTITARVKNGKTFNCKVTVQDTAKLNKTKLSMTPGDSQTLKISGLNNRKVTWTSSDRKVATVKDGKVTAVYIGSCAVTAQIKNGKKLTCTVTVTDPAALSVDNLTISTIDYAKIKLTGALKRKVTWSTSDAGVVKITKSDSGAASIKAVKKGTATITAKIAGGKTLKCAVKVVDPLTIKEDWDDDFSDLASWEVGLKFTNNSNKKIIYVTFDILQYNNRGDRLKSPYDYYYFNNDIDPHDYYYDNYTVNDDTRSVKFKIREVTFADKTTWKP